jgi:hypothetical protein
MVLMATVELGSCVLVQAYRAGLVG